MSRTRLALTLTAALLCTVATASPPADPGSSAGVSDQQVAHSAPAPDPGPSTPAEPAPPSLIPSDPRAQLLLAVLTGASSVVGAWGLYTVRVNKSKGDLAAQRDAADLAAIQVRDKSFAEAMATLTEAMKSNSALVAENSANKTRLELVEKSQAERDQREREQGQRLAVVEAQLRSITGHVRDCGGGSPCPLAHLKGERHD